MEAKRELKIWGCQAYCPDTYNSCRCHNDECSYRNTTVPYVHADLVKELVGYADALLQNIEKQRHQMQIFPSKELQAKLKSALTAIRAGGEG